MIIRRFKPEDGMAIGHDLKEFAWNDVFTLTKFRQIKGPAYTVVHNGKVIACGGVVVQGYEGNVWAILANTTIPRLAHRFARQGLSQIVRFSHLKRVYGLVRSDFPEGQHYLKFLGFKLIGPVESNQKDGADTLKYVKESA